MDVIQPLHALSVDIGGSKISAAIYDEHGAVYGFRRIELESPPDPHAIRELLDAFVRDTDAERTPDVVGVAVPGLVDIERGEWVYSPFGRTRGFSVAAFVHDLLGVPAYIDNDVNMCALAEHRFGVCRGERDFLWITMSNGVGGALYLDGSLYRGASGHAGEIGHVVVDPAGRRADTQILGSLEAYSSGRAIVAEYLSRTGREENIDAAVVSERAMGGESAALETFQSVGRAVGRAIATAVNLLNLPLVVIGGGVAQSFDLFEAPLRDAMLENVFREANEAPRVLRSDFPLRAASIGAAVCAFDALRKENG